MKFLIIGSGAREYSMGLALKQENHTLFFAPGNGASKTIGTNVDSKICKNDKSFKKILKFAQDNNIDYTIVGNEAPLVDGIVDVFKKNNLKIFGPSKKAAKLEGSKTFMKNFLHKYNIPTAKSLQTSDYEEAKEFIQNLHTDIVIKADGLCAGKGVIITSSVSEALKICENMLNGKSFGDAGKSIIVEEFLDGYELSVFAICDDNSHILLPPCQDHKQLLDGDKGVNTGGMGAYAPTPLCSSDMLDKINKSLITPTLQALKKQKNPFNGVLFAGVMIVNNEPYLLEYNVRFGDPECEILLPLLKTPFSNIVINACENKLSDLKLEFKDLFCVGVVLASENYPFSSSKKQKITLNANKEIFQNTLISYGGVSSDDKALYADGGRVCVCIGLDKSLQKAKQNAYKLVSCIDFKGKKYRNDISNKALGNIADTKNTYKTQTHSEIGDINEHIAPLKLRYKAFFIDEFIVSVVAMILMWNDLQNASVDVFSIVEVVSSWAPYIIALRIAYQAFFVWYYGATLGKMRAKIRVVSIDKAQNIGRVNLINSIIRAISRFISEAYLLYAGFFVAHFTKSNQTAHDFLAKTIVIEVY